MEQTSKLKSRYPGPPEVARAFERATADVYEASEYSNILAFEVCDASGAVLGRFEGWVSLINTTPEQFVAATRGEGAG